MMAALRKAAATGGGENDEGDAGDGGGGGDDGGGGGDGAHEVKLAAVESQKGTRNPRRDSAFSGDKSGGFQKAGGKSQRFECGSRWHSGLQLAAVERQSKRGRGTHGVIVPSPVVNPEGSKKAGGESQRF